MSKSTGKPERKKSAEKLSAKDSNQNTGENHEVEITVNGMRVEVDPAVRAAVLRAYQASRQPLPKEMTTNQAADYLDVSRPFVIKLVRRGELPCRMVGKHRRIPSSALVEYRKKMLQKATAALDEMTRMLEEAGVYHEMQGPPPKATKKP